MIDKTFYTTGLCKGQGMIAETVALLKVWEPGMDPVELNRKVLAEGLIPKGTASRVKDIVSRVFAFRYLNNGDLPAAYLKSLVEAGMSSEKLSQIFLIHTARAHRELHDFITEIYWPRYAAGTSAIQRDESIRFFRDAYLDGRLPNEWTETSREKIGRYLLTALADFWLLGPMKGGKREILPVRLHRTTSLYLAHELHFSGLSDSAIRNHEDWRLFGLEPGEVVAELIRVSGGWFMVQDSGEIFQISWRTKTMEEFLHAVAEREL